MMVAALLCIGFGAAQMYRMLAASEATEELALLEPAIHDFGNVRQSEELSQVLRLTNTSPSTVEVVGLHATCKCTELPRELLGSKIAPGEAIEIPAGMRTGTSTEQIVSKVAVYVRPYPPVDRRQVSVVQATFRASVMPDFRLDPDHVDLGDVDTSLPIERVIYFVPLADPKVRVIGVRAPQPELSAAVEESSNDRQPQVIRLKIDASSIHSRRPIGGRIEIETTSERAGKVSVSVQGRAIPRIELQPEEIVVTESGASNQSTLRIRTALPSVVKSVECTIPDCEPSTTFDVSSQLHTISVSLPGEGSVDGELRVDLDLVREGEDDGVQAHHLVVPIHRLELKGD